MTTQTTPIATTARPTGNFQAPVDVDLLPRIPPGIYTLAFVSWRTQFYLKDIPKVALMFRVVDQGPYFETLLPRWYRVKSLKGRAGIHGGFKLGASMHLLRDYISWTDRNPRIDRVALCHLIPLLFQGRVEDVRGDHRQRELPEGARYSVLRDITVIKT